MLNEFTRALIFQFEFICVGVVPTNKRKRNCERERECERECGCELERSPSLSPVEDFVREMVKEMKEMKR